MTRELHPSWSRRTGGQIHRIDGARVKRSGLGGWVALDPSGNVIRKKRPDGNLFTPRFSTALQASKHADALCPMKVPT